MTLHQLNKSLIDFDIKTAAVDSVRATKETIIDYNKHQLLRGKTSNGNFLSPKYSEDPYFKSRESALRYATWKKSIEPATDKPFDVPNLFITGYFHGSIKIRVDQKDYRIYSEVPLSVDIENKFGDENIYGLNDESRREYIPEFLLPELKARIENKTLLRF